jgi:adenylosuccinate synthase
VTTRLTVVLLSGPISAGKSGLADSLVATYEASDIRSSVLLASLMEGPVSRADLQRVGLSPIFQSGDWLARAIQERASNVNSGLIVVDSVRTAQQVAACRKALGDGRRVVHVHLTADEGLLADRFLTRSRAEDQGLSWHEAMQSAQEASGSALGELADLVIDTSPLTPADVAVRVGAYVVPRIRQLANVDVLVGGQWGSEGKGNIAFALAPEYDLLVRVGAPNAGHKVRTSDGTVYTHRSLPSGTLATKAPVLLGPGSVIDTKVLLQEISDCGLRPERLTVDRRALIIEDEDVRKETELKKAIGSTGTGGGAAVARRIMGRDPDAGVRTAGDVPALAPFIGDATEQLSRVAQAGGSVFIEGTQGTALSVLHGSFPYVTSRDTTVGTLLAEVGVPPQAVRHVVVVFRTYPIRVGGQSGPMGREIAWHTVAERSGILEEVLLNSERGSVSNNQRRVAEFDWTQLVSSARLNGATDIALTFADYLDVRNREAWRFDQLTSQTRRFVEEIETTVRLPVSLIAANFDGRGLIDRRHW